MKKMQIELEDCVHARLVVDSKQNRRSLKQHVLWLLENHALSCALPAETTNQVPATNDNHAVLAEQIESFFATETLGLSAKDALQSYDSYVDAWGKRWLVLDDFLAYLRSVGTEQVRRDRVVKQLRACGWALVRLSTTDPLTGAAEERVYYCHTDKAGDV